MVYRTLATTLHIGNLFFRSNGDDRRPQLANENELAWVSAILEVENGALLAFLINETSSVDECLDRRDALAKALYRELFHWILSHITMFNQKGPETARREQAHSVTLVDIPGMAVGVGVGVAAGLSSLLIRYHIKNPPRAYNGGAEDLGINAANERMESFFVQRVFKELSAAYAEERINVPSQLQLAGEKYNQVELLMKRPIGVVPLLEDECKFPKVASIHLGMCMCEVDSLLRAPTRTSSSA